MQCSSKINRYLTGSLMYTNVEVKHCCRCHLFNPFMPSGFFYLNSLNMFISYIRGVWLVLLLSCFIEISELNANSVDYDQTPHSAASDLGLHCLSVSLKWDARLKKVKFCIFRLRFDGVIDACDIQNCNADKSNTKFPCS